MRTVFAVAAYGLLQCQGRSFEPGDLFRLEAISGVQPSPDGRLVAIVRVRPKATARVYVRNFMDGDDRSDLWIYDLQNAKLTKIADGRSDGAGFFSPSWSPDGQHLAMLSTRGGTVSLWAWKRSTSVLWKVSSETVELGRPVWISNREAVCATPPDGEQPVRLDLDFRASLRAAGEWQKARTGSSATASALVSSSQPQAAKRPDGRILKFDILAKTAAVIARGTFAALDASPDKRRLTAFELAEIMTPRDGERLPNRNPLKYRLVTFEGLQRRVLVELDQQHEPLPGAVAWTANGTVAVRIAGLAARPDWFAILPDGMRVNLTAALPAVPSMLAAHPDGASFVAAAGNRLWRISTDGKPPEPITDGNRIEVESIALQDSPVLVVRGRKEQRRGFFAIDVRTNSIRDLPSPGENVDVMAIAPRSLTILAAGQEPGGGTALRSWSGMGASSRLVMRLNEFTAEIAEGRFRSFPYRSAVGLELTGWILLPPGYVEGDRCPTVVSVYPGLVYTPTTKPRGTLQSPGAYNPHLLSAKGYAVLFPSIPLSPEAVAGEPYAQIAEGVLPAVDEGIRLGFVDASRMAVWGHSYGGYGVYALVTQTARFRAAVALSGFANLTSLYGAIDPRFRYESFARERLLHMVFAESGQFRMGSPPWKDPARYARNSPISFIDRVTTPVLIIQGDQDYVPIQQGEEVFSALYRQQKEAVFVRYWGEGHIMESPANVLDMWKRIDDWLSQRVSRAAR